MGNGKGGRIQGGYAAGRLRLSSIVVTIAMVLAVAAAAFTAQAYDASGAGRQDEYLGCATNGNGGPTPTPIPEQHQNIDVGLTIEGYTRDEQGQYTKFVASNTNAPGTTIDLNAGDAQIDNLAASQPMHLDIAVNMANPHEVAGQQVAPTDWTYRLPFKYADIADASKNIVRYPPNQNDKLQAHMQIVRGCGDDDTAYIRVNYDRTWLAAQPPRLGFQFSADIRFQDDGSGSSGATEWTFPGIDQKFEVEWAKTVAPGIKNCYGDSASGGFKCDITISPEGELQNFVFWDDSTGMAIDPKSILFDDRTIAELGGTLSGAGTADDGRTYDFKIELPTLTAGSHKVSYLFTQQDGVQWNPATSSYDGTFRNEAWWNWSNGTETKATFDPNYEVKPGGSGGGGSQDHKTNIFKNSEVLDNADYIKWTIGVNSSDKRDIGGFRVTDTLGGKHDYVFSDEYPLTVNVKDANGHWVVYTKFPGGSTDKGTFVYEEKANSFTYTFPADAGEHEYQLVYYTQPEKHNGVSVDMSVSNDASVCDPKDCEATQGSTQGTATIRDPLKPSVWKNNVQSSSDGNEEHKWDPSDGAVKSYPGNDKFLLVPWSVVFDPSAELAANPDAVINKLELKEDWVNAHSDGNTLHMWYSADTIDLKIYTQDAGGNWQLMPANSYELRANYDGNKELPSTSTTYPAPWFDENDNKTGSGQIDHNTLHQGIPRIKIKFNETRITGPVKIVYNTIFDRMPDTYINYAVFRYEVNGKGYDTDYVSTTYVYSDKDTLQAGKATDIEHFGKDYWDNKAKIRQCTAVDPSATSLADQECFQTDWTVWANGPKPWGQPTTSDPQVDYWDKGISGALPLDNITFTDTLPQGWKLVPGSLKAIVLTPTYNNGQVTTVDRYAEIKDLSSYFSQDAQKFTVKIDNLNTALNGAECSVSGVVEKCPADLTSMKRMIKFEYSTYLPYSVAKDNGYKRGDTVTYTNYASLKIGEIDAETQGSTVIYRAEKDEGVLDKQLAQSTNAGNNTLKYSITINKNVTDYNKDYTGTDFFDGNNLTHLTLTDTLSPLGEYVPDSLRIRYIFSNGNKDGVEYKPTVTYEKDGATQTSTNIDKWKLLREDATWSENSASMPDGWTKAVERNPDTGAQSLTVTIPKEFLVVNDQDGEWISTPDGGYRELLYGTLPFNDHVGVELTYEVRVNGLPGQTLQGFSNTAQLRGETTHDDETSNDVVIPNLSGSVWQTVTPKIRKVDANTGTPLGGAQFSLQQVDLRAFYTDDAMATLKGGAELDAAAQAFADGINDGQTLGFTDVRWMQPFTDRGVLYLQSGNDGITLLPSMYEPNQFDYTNTLFILNEIRAPSGYELTTKDVYMVPVDTAAGAQARLNNLIAILDAVNANIRLAKNKIMPLYPDANNRLTFGNDKITDVMWGKVEQDNNKITQGNPTMIEDPLYLNGSEWRIETANPADPEAEQVCVEGDGSQNGLLPCTIYVRDNDDAGQSTGEGMYVPDADKATGMIMVQHLKPDVTYTLTEVKAPEGYIKSDEAYQFSIDQDGNTTWTGGHVPWLVIDDAGSTGIRVIGNAKEEEPGVEMPSAGGAGIHFAAFGLAFIAAGMMLAVIAQKNRKRGAHAAPRLG